MFMRRLATVLTGTLIAISAIGVTSTASAAPSKPAPPTGPGTDALVAYLLYNDTTGKCADVPGFGAGRVDGPINQYTCDGTANDNQLWYFHFIGYTPNWEPLYQIQNAKDGLCVDVPNFGAVPATTKVSEYYCRGAEDNQFYRLSWRYDGYWIVNDKSGLCLDVDGFATGGNDARLTLYYCSDYDDHIWQLR
jgi:hypothetical protein